MGNFAENLNLGDRFRPPHPELFVALLQETEMPLGCWEKKGNSCEA